MDVYLNSDESVGRRVGDLLQRLTREEKFSLMRHASPAVERLGIPAYNWWNEGIHGVGRAGIATVFPQCIGMGATFDPGLVGRVASAVSLEARAKHHDAVKRGLRSTYRGLTFWAPNVNIFRDPRWGRGQETYGEDPYLTGRMGVEFVRELQGDDPVYFRTIATPKHFAVHSGPERGRHGFDSVVSRKDLGETYLPAFRAAVVEGGAFSVMSAYNRLNGVPCSANRDLLNGILRGEWGFSGCVVSDCGAIDDIHEHHGYTGTPVESAAAAVNGGCDLACGESFSFLGKAVEAGLLSDAAIDAAVSRVLEARFRLGLFDPPERVRWASIPYSVVECEAHRNLAREAAAASIVLLANRNGTLPLAKTVGSLAVVGPNAASVDALLGNYNGTPSRPVTVLDGIVAAVSSGTRVHHEEGCPLFEPGTKPEETGAAVSDAPGPEPAANARGTGNGKTPESRANPADPVRAALAAAEKADAVIAVLGLSPRIEGEEGDAYNTDASGDRPDLDLPGRQRELFDALVATGKPVILVLLGGTAFAIPDVVEKAAAVLDAWYPGCEGGNAVADVLFGDVNPSGRLPLTFPRSVSDLPPFNDYSMEGRTYRYSETEPLFPFGFGLSYTRFEYADLTLSLRPDSEAGFLRVGVMVTNAGTRSGCEAVQLYVRDEEASCRAPKYQLRGVLRIGLDPGASRVVEFTLHRNAFELVLPDGSAVLEPGLFTVFVGGSQPDGRSFALTGVKCLSSRFRYVPVPQAMTGNTRRRRFSRLDLSGDPTV